MALIGLALFLAGSVDVTNAQQPASGAIPSVSCMSPLTGPPDRPATLTQTPIRVNRP